MLAVVVITGAVALMAGLVASQQRAIDQYGEEQGRAVMRFPCVVRAALDDDLAGLYLGFAAFED